LPKEVLMPEQPVVWWLNKEVITPWDDHLDDGIVDEIPIDDSDGQIDLEDTIEIWQDMLQEQAVTTTSWPLQLELPHDPLILKQLVTLIKEHPGTHPVMLGSAIKHVSEEGLEKIQIVIQNF
jgi:hypothetical protein